MNPPSPTPYDFMMAQEPKWVTSPTPDPLDNIPHPDNRTEPLRQPANDTTTAGPFPDDVRSIFPNLYVDLLEDGGTTYFTVSPGSVRYQNMGGAPLSGPVGVIEPTLGGTALTNDPPPQQAAAAGKVFVRVQTSSKGVPNGTATIVFVATASLPQASVHHRPADPVNVAVDGDYYFELATIADLGGGEFSISDRKSGQINIPNQIIQIENLGGEAAIFKEYVDDAPDTYDLRTIGGRGSYTGDTPDAGTTEQIKDVVDGDVVRVIGNGKTKTLAVTYGLNSPQEVDWNDGLIVTGSDVSIDIHETVARGAYAGDTPDAGTTAQIQVVADGNQKRVLGNGKTKTLAVTYGINSPQEVDWNDGLITTGADVDIDIHEVEGRGGYTTDTPDVGTTEQIQVVEDGNIKRVLGNKKVGSLAFDGGSPVLNWNDGLCTTSGAVNVNTTTSHPWKLSNAGSGNVAIAAGFIQGYFLTYGWQFPGVPGGGTQATAYGPDEIVLGPAGSYAGGTAAVTGTQYVYAEIARNNTSGTPNEYAESFDDTGAGDDVLVELSDDLQPSLLQAATIVVSSSAADAYTPTSGKAAVCLGKVTNTAGVITVDAQYTTHNPTLFIPRVLVLVG